MSKKHLDKGLLQTTLKELMKLEREVEDLKKQEADLTSEKNILSNIYNSNLKELDTKFNQHHLNSPDNNESSSCEEMELSGEDSMQSSNSYPE
ncbi:MAG: hypothetical protein H0U78_05040 [Rickettsiaceae bacterium]|jgi:Zn-dependent oligopeptidase|nr:hypothetical protein [Rickettsiaceae bacterium]